jgi:outer membrane cobalamin receptor
MKNANLSKTGLLMATCLFLFICSNAQEFLVKGKLVDSVSKKPVANATINFLQPQKKASTTVVSDKDGAFKTSLLQGPYKVTITHTSFRIKVKLLAVQEKDIEMGNIELLTMVKNLAGVTVTAARPMVEQKDDRLIYNVEDDPTAKSESATDILRKTPYVNVDGDGAIQVNGQANFKVLLNGRETALFSQNVKEALKGFPGATISRIEVITSPSAKYDAEGVGGIINIITKKKLAGYNGTVNSNVTTIGNNTGGVNFNMKTGKLGISAVYSFMSNQNYRTRTNAITTPGQPIAFVRRELGGPKETDVFFQQANLELSYDLDSMHTLVVYGNRNKVRNEAMNQHNSYTLFANGNSETSPFPLQTTMELPAHGFGTDFIKKYKGKPQKELSFRFNAIYNTNRSFSNSQQGTGAYERYILNNSEAFNNEYTVQIDFTNPLNKTTRLETGVKTILRNAYSYFQSQVKYTKAEPYQFDPSNTNKFSYDQDVYGGYMSLNKTFKKALTVRIGLRIEHTRVHGDFTSTNSEVDQIYTNFIPNLLLTKQISKTMSSNLSYTFRLGRPPISMLNPFINNNDSLYKSFGNPDLGAQYIHMIAWQYRLFKGSKFISFQTGFNFANNLIIQSPTFDPATGVTSVSPANAGRLRDFSLGFTSNLPLGKKWNIAVNATGRYAHARNNLQGEWINSTAGNVNGNFSYKANKLFTISSNAGYFVPLRTPNTTFPDNYFYGFNFAHKLFKEKLNITANVINFFEEERTLRSKTENQSFVTENIGIIPFRNFGLALSYNFGKLKENVSKKKGVNNDDQVQGQ